MKKFKLDTSLKWSVKNLQNGDVKYFDDEESAKIESNFIQDTLKQCPSIRPPKFYEE